MKNVRNKRYNYYADGGMSQRGEQDEMGMIKESLMLLITVGMIDEKQAQAFMEQYTKSPSTEKRGIAEALASKVEPIKQEIAEQQMAQQQMGQQQGFNRDPQGGIPAGMGAQVMGMPQGEQYPEDNIQMGEHGGMIECDEFGNAFMIPAYNVGYTQHANYGVPEMYQDGGKLSYSSPKKDFQAALNKLGYRDNRGRELEEDNILGVLTGEAVKKFQADNNIDTDGILRLDTIKALNEALERKSSKKSSSSSKKSASSKPREADEDIIEHSMDPDDVSPKKSAEESITAMREAIAEYNRLVAEEEEKKSKVANNPTKSNPATKTLVEESDSPSFWKQAGEFALNQVPIYNIYKGFNDWAAGGYDPRQAAAWAMPDMPGFDVFDLYEAGLEGGDYLSQILTSTGFDDSSESILSFPALRGASLATKNIKKIPKSLSYSGKSSAQNRGEYLADRILNPKPGKYKKNFEDTWF
jgi:hypothetical protein